MRASATRRLYITALCEANVQIVAPLKTLKEVTVESSLAASAKMGILKGFNSTSVIGATIEPEV